VGQLTTPSLPGWTILATDREYAPGAGPGASGNNVIMIGLNAGKNSAIANSIIQGNNTADAGITDLNLNGSTIIGAQSAQSLVQATGAPPASNAGMTILGSNNINAATRMDSTVIIGSGNMPLATAIGTSQSVIIGNNNFAAAVGLNFTNSIAIGDKIAPLMANFGQQFIAIGYNILAACTSDATASVIIGNSAASTVGGGGFNPPTGLVLIGDLSDTPNGTLSSVVIGYSNITRCTNGGTSIGNVTVGANISTSGSDSVGLNTIIGYNARTPATMAAGRNTVIGANAGLSLATAVDHIFCVEVNNAGATAQQAILFGSFATGNIVIGNSTDAASRDLISGGTATNTLRLLNGTKAGANPASGGYFYVAAGLLHWVDQSGNDLNINGAVGTGTSTPTFAATNKPGATTAAGPATWMPITVNGTLYQIPLWAN